MITRGRLGFALLAVLFAAGVISCLFSMFLPASASWLAPTTTNSPTFTLTPTITRTSTITSTPLSISGLNPTPVELGTPYIQLAAYTHYVSRDLWQVEAGQNLITEDFESDAVTYDELALPHATGNQFTFEGNSLVQIIGDRTLLTTGNLVLFRDPGHGLTVIFPNDMAARAFGFDYTASDDETWFLSFNDVVIKLPAGQNKFIGFVFYQNYPKQFTLSCYDQAQHGLSIDNISYAP